MVNSSTFLHAAAAVALGSMVALGCSSSAKDAPTDVGSTSDCAVTIDRFKELVIVDDAVVTDARSKNATAGPWSFHTLLKAVIPQGGNPNEFISAWLDDWANTSAVNGFATDVESRAVGLNQHLVCPWLQRTPENQCDATCGTCRSRQFDIAKAPFRLIGLTYRFDLHDRPDPDADSLAGEARFIFGLTEGAADDPASPMRAMTLIFEYTLPDPLTPRQWADAWHHLGTHATFDEGYRADLQSITDRFTAAGAAPKRPSGSALARIRTNESAFNWIWQLRQFTLDGGGQLRLSTVTNTPPESLNGTPELRDYILKNADAIKADRHVVPKSMTAGSADLLRFRWTIPGVDEQTRMAFARSTCNGCHAGEHPTIDTAFHISPFRSGTDKVSAFLNDPLDREHDELSKRELQLKTVLCDNK